MSIRCCPRHILWPVFLLLFTVPNVLASNWSAAERELTSKIVGVTGPGAVSFSVENRSSLTPSELNAISADLRGQFEAAGMRIVNADQAAATIQITLSENVQAYLWVGRIQQGNN